MSQRTFEFRLRSSHSAPARQTQSLLVEFLEESGVWVPQTPSLGTPGFRLYLLSLLLCQHHYLVANALERELPLQQVTGRFSVTTSVDWLLEQVSGDFSMQLDSSAGPEALARANDEAIASIASRMKLCPVSRNLSASVDKHIALALEPVG